MLSVSVIAQFSGPCSTVGDSLLRNRDDVHMHIVSPIAYPGDQLVMSCT